MRMYAYTYIRLFFMEARFLGFPAQLTAPAVQTGGDCLFLAYIVFERSQAGRSSKNPWKQ